MNNINHETCSKNWTCPILAVLICLCLFHGTQLFLSFKQRSRLIEVSKKLTVEATRVRPEVTKLEKKLESVCVTLTSLAERNELAHRIVEDFQIHRYNPPAKKTK